MPNVAANRILSAFSEAEATRNATQLQRVLEAALIWSTEREQTLVQEVASANSGDTALFILDLTGKTPSEEEKAKLDCLNRLLGIDIMSKAKIRDVRYDSHGDRHEWSVEITVSRLIELLQASR